jgi:HSP20 family protein
MKMTTYNSGRQGRERYRDLAELMQDFWDGGDTASAASWAPRLDVHENKDSYTIKADLPGMEKKDIQVTVEDGVLSIRGERQSQQETGEGGNWHRLERHYGSFLRSLDVGDSVDAEKVKAEYKDGVLTLTLPKKEAAKPRLIDVG